MKAIIQNTKTTGKIIQNRKEKHFYQQYSVIDSNLNELVVCRIYATNSTSYACIWVHSSETKTYISGGGKASGYGYHKASSAVSNAIRDAEITLSEDIDGRGDSAIENALLAISKELTSNKCVVFKAHA